MKSKASATLLSTVSSGSLSPADGLGKRLEGKTRALSYREWLKKNGALTNAGAPAVAGTKRAKNAPDYGAAAERLADRGLAKTGYADYLREQNETAYREAITGAKEQNAAKQKSDRKGYLAYLKDWENAQDELMKSTLSSLAASKVPGIAEAYASALAAGLTDDRANLVSRVAPVLGKYGARRLRQGIAGILSVSLESGLTGEEAELLARALGIGEVDARELRQTVENTPPGAAVSSADAWERN